MKERATTALLRMVLRVIRAAFRILPEPFYLSKRLTSFPSTPEEAWKAAVTSIEP